MDVTITLFRCDGSKEDRVLDLPELPDIYDLRELINPMLDGDHLEHVSVFHDGRRADLFVGERSALDRKPRNEAATAIYRAASMARHPDQDPESLPAIYGPAVLFHRRVWF